jgi:serine/threonine protein kinase
VKRLRDEKIFTMMLIEFKTNKEKKELENRITLMRLSKSSFVQDIEEVFEYRQRFWIICESIVADFTELLIDFKTNYSEKFVKYACYRVLQGIQFLHEQNIIHRDIKSDSFWITPDGDLKLSDFDFACQLTQQV